MARLHSRKKGKSGSTRPSRLEKPAWIEHSAEDVENQVVKLARKGFSKSMIGIFLRDSYGVPLVKTVTGRRIKHILEDNGIKETLPEDLVNLVKKALIIRKHMEGNHKDLQGKKGLQRTEAKIYRLIKYYKKKRILKEDFKYNPEKMRTLVAR